MKVAVSAASHCMPSLVSVQSNVSNVHCVREISLKSIKVALFTLGNFIKNFILTVLFTHLQCIGYGNIT